MGQVKDMLIRTTILLCFFSFIFSGLSFGYEDPLGVYSVVVPETWIYQSQKSHERLSVFYGEGEYDLLYFEHLGTSTDPTVEDFCKRTLAMFEGVGGLKNFKLEVSPEPVEIGDKQGLATIYTYEDQNGTKLWEYRVFLLLQNQQAFTFTLGGGGSWTESEFEVLQGILTQWRWLF